jgi:ribosomal-protein-serine acetyltransferase
MFSYLLAEGAELRPLEPWQAGQFAGYVERARGHLAPWLPWATTITDVATAGAFLQRYADTTAHDGGRIYGIWLDDVLVGGALFRIFDVQSGTCELGVWLTPDAGGRGLVTMAARALIEWAVDTRGVARVEWHVEPTNERSIAVARRLGMTREGVLRQAFELNGVRRDMEIWSLLAAERG